MQLVLENVTMTGRPIRSVLLTLRVRSISRSGTR